MHTGVELPAEEIANIERTLLEECGTPNQQSSESESASAAKAPEEATASTADNPEEKAGSPDEKEADSAEKKTPEKKVPAPALDALLRARRALTAALKAKVAVPFEISLTGLETGEVEAVIRARKNEQVSSTFPP